MIEVLLAGCQTWVRPSFIGQAVATTATSEFRQGRGKDFPVKPLVTFETGMYGTCTVLYPTVLVKYSPENTHLLIQKVKTNKPQQHYRY